MRKIEREKKHEWRVWLWIDNNFRASANIHPDSFPFFRFSYSKYSPIKRWIWQTQEFDAQGKRKSIRKDFTMIKAITTFLQVKRTILWLCFSSHCLQDKASFIPKDVIEHYPWQNSLNFYSSLKSWSILTTFSVCQTDLKHFSFVFKSCLFLIHQELLDVSQVVSQIKYSMATSCSKHQQE